MSETTDMGLVLQSEHGRRLVYSLIQSSGCKSAAIKSDYQTDLIHRGRQSMGLMIENMARESDFERYIQMIREDRDNERSSRTNDE